MPKDKFQSSLPNGGAGVGANTNANETQRMMYSTMSGSDIKAVFGGVEISNLSGISISINREVSPVFTMGSENARSVTKGKRGIAGSMVMTVFDRAALWDIQRQAQVYTASQKPGQSGVYANQKDGAVRYSDQLPPFNITLTGANEYGTTSVMAIYSVNLISEGQSMSMEDNAIESQLTFVALGVDWFRPTSGAQAGSGDQFTISGAGGLDQGEGLGEPGV